MSAFVYCSPQLGFERVNYLFFPRLMPNHYHLLLYLGMDDLAAELGKFLTCHTSIWYRCRP